MKTDLAVRGHGEAPLKRGGGDVRPRGEFVREIPEVLRVTVRPAAISDGLARIVARRYAECAACTAEIEPDTHLSIRI